MVRNQRRPGRPSEPRPGGVHPEEDVVENDALNVEGTIDPKGNRLTIGPNGRVKANVNACAVVVQGRLEGNIQASDRVDLKQSAVVRGDIATQRIPLMMKAPTSRVVSTSRKRSQSKYWA